MYGGIFVLLDTNVHSHKMYSIAHMKQVSRSKVMITLREKCWSKTSAYIDGLLYKVGFKVGLVSPHTTPMFDLVG
jgi:hypothetical protein